MRGDMFHFSDDELWSILNNEHSSDSTYFASLYTKARAEYKPKFFKPYPNIKEFAQELVSPAVDPLRLCGIAAGASIGSIIATVACIGGLLLAGSASLFMNTKLRDTALNGVCMALSIVGSGLVTAASCLLLAILSIPYNLGSLLTRTVSSLITANEPDTLSVK